MFLCDLSVRGLLCETAHLASMCVLGVCGLLTSNPLNVMLEVVLMRVNEGVEDT